MAYFLAYKTALFDSLILARGAATVVNTKCSLDFTTAFLHAIGCN